MTEIVCKSCGNMFRYQRLTASGAPRKYCDACRYENGRAKTASRSNARLVVCPNCSVEFVAPNGYWKYCGDKCRKDFDRRKKVDSGVRLSPCRRCGGPKERVVGGVQFCDACLVVKKADINNRKNHKRRAGGNPLPSVDDVVAARGTRCHICGKQINTNSSRMSPGGLTIDHLLPVSMGGTNDLSNLHVAHRRCNTARGNRGSAQLIFDVG